MPTIRRKCRKIGRNEPCPCGRAKDVEIKLWRAQARAYGWMLGKDEPVDTMVTKVPVKYKHCCGNIDNQREAMVVRRYIANKIHEVLSHKKVSKLHALVNFFKKKS